MGTLIAILLASPIEWAIHRYVCHNGMSIFRWFREIHAEHHSNGRHFEQPFASNPVFVDGLPRTFSKQKLRHYFSRTSLYGLIGMAIICLPAGLISRNNFYIAGITVTVFVLSALATLLHEASHEITPKRLFGARWLITMWKRHQLHHLDPSKNLNLLNPIGDILLGTYVPGEQSKSHGRVIKSNG